MGNSTGRIIKAKDIKLDGNFRLNTGYADSNTPNASAGNGIASGTTLQVNIVENHAEYAVLEVTCSCGAKTHLKCQYENTQANQQPQNQNTGADNNEAQ